MWNENIISLINLVNNLPLEYRMVNGTLQPTANIMTVVWYGSESNMEITAASSRPIYVKAE